MFYSKACSEIQCFIARRAVIHSSVFNLFMGNMHAAQAVCRCVISVNVLLTSNTSVQNEQLLCNYLLSIFRTGTNVYFSDS